MAPHFLEGMTTLCRCIGKKIAWMSLKAAAESEMPLQAKPNQLETAAGTGTVTCRARTAGLCVCF
jgi:hypothetical protein